MSVADGSSLEGSSRFSRLLPRGNLSGSLYGLILVTSVMVTFDDQDVELVGLALVVTAAVFALAHAWAHALGTAATTHMLVDRHAFVRSITHEWPIVQAALPSVLVLALAAAGLYSVQTGLWIAAVANVLLLFVWGAGLRELAGGTLAQALTAGLSSAALGLVLVALKALVH
jgi:hypothetical protein